MNIQRLWRQSNLNRRWMWIWTITINKKPTMNLYTAKYRWQCMGLFLLELTHNRLSTIIGQKVAMRDILQVINIWSDVKDLFKSMNRRATDLGYSQAYNIIEYTSKYTVIHTKFNDMSEYWKINRETGSREQVSGVFGKSDERV